MPSISLIIHTKNSASTVENALRSAKIVVQEIIIMDMQSTDNTVQICKKYTSNIVLTEDVGYVEPARNQALKLATKEWILILDADEKLSLGLSEWIRTSFLRSKKQEHVGYLIPRKNLIFGRWAKTGWWPDYQLRLFKTGSVTWQKTIHSAPKIDGKTTKLPAREDMCIEHVNYVNVHQYVERLNRYTDIESKNPRQDLNPLSAFWAEFLNRFMAKNGVNQQVYGESLACLQGMYMALACLKANKKMEFDPDLRLRLRRMVQEYWHWYCLYKRQTSSVFFGWKWILIGKIPLYRLGFRSSKSSLENNHSSVLDGNIQHWLEQVNSVSIASNKQSQLLSPLMIVWGVLCAHLGDTSTTHCLTQAELLITFEKLINNIKQWEMVQFEQQHSLPPSPWTMYSMTK